MITPTTNRVHLTARLAGRANRRVAGIAYTGAIIAQPFGQVVIDLQSATLPDRVALLLDHANTIGAVAGYLEPRLVGTEIVVTGALADTEAGSALAAILASGAPLQLSIGGPFDTLDEAPPEGARVNGQQIKPPVLIARGMTIDEVSAVPLGADANTSLIAASRAGRNRKEATMTFDEYLQSIGITDSTKIEAAQLAGIRARYEAAHPTGQGEREQPSGAADELARVKAIRTACADVADGEALAAEGIRSNWPVQAVERIALERIRASRPQTGMSTSGARSSVAPQRIIEAALSIRLGNSEKAEKALGAPAMNAATDTGLDRASLYDMAVYAIRASGQDVPAGREQVIKAAMQIRASGFSTVSLPTALANTIGRSVEEAYTDAPATWRAFAAARSAPDFRERTAIRPNSTGSFEEVGATGEVPHGSIGEEQTLSWTATTYAKMLRLSRRDIMNDDIGIITEAVSDMGRKAESKVSDVVYDLIRANAGSFFGTGNNNYFEGAPTNLSLASLTVGIRTMRKQVDSQSRPIVIVPRYLLVPPELETTAKSILNSIEIQAATDAPSGNPHYQSLELLVEPRLSASALSGYSETAWFITGGPAAAPLIVGGVGSTTPRPIVETFPDEPEYLGTAWRVVLDAGAALGDPRAWVKSKGAV